MQELFPLESSWVVALCAGALALIMLLRLARSLPAQNIVLIVAGLLAVNGLIDFFLAKYGWVDVTGPLWCYVAGAALLWMAVVLSLRRVAQFILHPWRGGRWYGIWVIGMSAVFTAAFQFGWPCLLVLDPDALPVPPDRAGIMAGMRGGATVLLLTGLSPWFIRKRPGSRARRSQLAPQPEKEAQ
jgi:hypothetical protein